MSSLKQGKNAMASTPAPSMSDRGWIYNPAEKADFALSWFEPSREP